MILVHRTRRLNVDHVDAVVANDFLESVSGQRPDPMLTAEDFPSWGAASAMTTFTFHNVGPLSIVRDDSFLTA